MRVGPMRRSDVVVLIVIVLVVVGVILPLLIRGRELEQSMQCKNNLRLIGLSLGRYYDCHESFPFGTIPNSKLSIQHRLSWMVSILPYIEGKTSYVDIDKEKAWDDRDNQIPIAFPLRSFLCPAYPKEQ